MCGTKLSSGQGVRLNVHTGTSIAGFNLSPNIVFNLVLNGIFRRRTPSVRSYYSKRTVCTNCAASIRAFELKKIVWLLGGALIISAVIIGMFIVASVK
jgi:hypothetical protein